ncbi:MAG: hypothetical protein ACF8XB_13150 [Planctomycetota bacterium JB042]
MSARRLLALVLVVLVVVWWAVPSDVVRLVAEQDPVILGRYSENKAYALLLSTPILLIAAALLASRVRFDRPVRFRLYAVALSSVVCFVVVDVAARAIRKPRYVKKQVKALSNWPHKFKRLKDGSVKARPPSKRYEVHFADVPGEARTYEDAPPGFPPVDVVLTSDERGFRNPVALERADVLAFGDSFTEGSRVSDDEVWVALLRERLGRSIYNLGMSGTSPRGYRNALIAYGLPLEPRMAVFLIYEGNDLKEHRADKEVPTWKGMYDDAQEFVKGSPIVKAFRQFVEDSLGDVFADGPLPPNVALSWMPVEVEAGGTRHHAAFDPDDLCQLYRHPEKFRKKKGWRNAAQVLREIVETCREASIRPVFLYAPAKEHVVLPLVKDRLPKDGFHAFASFEDDDLPPPEVFFERFFERIETQERTVLDLCEELGVECLSLTGPLREKMAEGVQVYYTYDQHWTRLGHRVVAEAAAPFLARRMDG